MAYLRYGVSVGLIKLCPAGSRTYDTTVGHRYQRDRGGVPVQYGEFVECHTDGASQVWCICRVDPPLSSW